MKTSFNHPMVKVKAVTGATIAETGSFNHPMVKVKAAGNRSIERNARGVSTTLW